MNLWKKYRFQNFDLDIDLDFDNTKFYVLSFKSSTYIEYKTI